MGEQISHVYIKTTMIYSVETRAETFIKKRTLRITKDNGSSYYGLYVKKTTRKKNKCERKVYA